MNKKAVKGRSKAIRGEVKASIKFDHNDVSLYNQNLLSKHNITQSLNKKRLCEQPEGKNKLDCCDSPIQFCPECMMKVKTATCSLVFL